MGKLQKRIRELNKDRHEIAIPIELSEALDAVEEMRNDIILTERDLYKQAVEWGEKGEMKVSAAFTRAGDAIRDKRMKWLS